MGAIKRCNRITTGLRALLKTAEKGKFPQVQIDWFRRQVEDAKAVRVVSVSRVFDEDDLALIRACVNPQAKQCYRNAHLLVELFPDRVQYCEGQVDCNYGFGIEHAFNKVDDVYVDITFELALGEEPGQFEYAAFGIYDLDVITRVANETHLYGDYYRTLWVEEQEGKKQPPAQV